MEYESKVIEEFAARLYARAQSLQFQYGFLGAISGLVAGGVIARILSTTSDEIGIGAVIGLVVGGAAGYAKGKEAGFLLRLKAQEALCQIQIEKNTRRS